MSTAHTTEQPKTTIRCWSYARTSNDEWETSEFSSLDAQQECNRAYIQSLQGEGYLFVRHIEDGGVSGGSLNRPGMQEVLRAVEAGEIDCIVVYKIDRLTRSITDFARLLEHFEAHGVTFVSVTQQFTTATAMGKLFLNIVLSFAQFERELAGERIRDKVAATKRKGRYTGGPPVLGYDIDYDLKALRLNPEEADLVRRIFADFIQCQSPTKVAAQLNAEGKTTKQYRTKKGTIHAGRPWNAMHVYRLLHNRVYLGQVVHKGQVYAGIHDAIITQTRWDRAQAILATNCRSRANASRSTTTALLKGIIRCGHCDASMGSTRSSRGNTDYRYYLCLRARKRGYGECPVGLIPAGTVEEAVVQQLRALFQSPELAAATYRSACELARTHGQMVAANVHEGEVVDALGRIEPIWDALYPEEQARIVRLLVEQVTVHEDGIEFALRVDGFHALVGELLDLTKEAVNA